MIKEAQIALCVGHIKEQYVCSLMTAFCSLMFLFKLEFKTAKSFQTDILLITMLSYICQTIISETNKDKKYWTTKTL